MRKEFKFGIGGLIFGFVFCLCLLILVITVSASEMPQDEQLETGQTFGQDEESEPLEPSEEHIEVLEDAQTETVETARSESDEMQTVEIIIPNSLDDLVTSPENQSVSDRINRTASEILSLDDEVPKTENEEFYIALLCALGLIFGSVLGLTFMTKFQMGV